MCNAPVLNIIAIHSPRGPCSYRVGALSPVRPVIVNHPSRYPLERFRIRRVAGLWQRPAGGNTKIRASP